MIRMKKAEFDAQIGRLKEVFGDRHYSTERIKVIGDWAKGCDRDLFAKAVTNAIVECQIINPPMLPKLKEFYEIERAKNPAAAVVERCPYCTGSGLICGEEVTPVTYRCRCPEGDRHAHRAAEYPGELRRAVPLESEIAAGDPDAVREVMGSAFKSRNVE